MDFDNTIDEQVGFPDMVFGWRHLQETDLEAILNGIVENKVFGGPYHLELFPTNKCNANCFFCFTEYYRKKQVLPFQVIEKVLVEGRRDGLKLIRLAGGGESLIHPDIDRILDVMGESGMWLSDVTTNGLTLKKHARKLVNIGSDYLYISLNEADAESYAKSMGLAPGMFDRAVEGIIELVSARNEAPREKRPVVAVQFFLHGGNIHQLHKMYKLACSLDVDEINIKSLMVIDEALRIRPEDIGKVKENLATIINDDCANGRFRLRFALAQEADLNEYVLKLQRGQVPPEKLNLDFNEKYPRHEYCVMGWFGATLTAEGKVYPCCVLQENDGKELGDVTQEGLHEIWRGKKYQQFRTQMRQNMLLRGNMHYSRRCHGCIDPICIPNFSCFFTYNLADAEFYSRLSCALEEKIPRHERIITKIHNQSLRKYHALKRAIRRG